MGGDEEGSRAARGRENTWGALINSPGSPRVQWVSGKGGDGELKLRGGRCRAGRGWTWLGEPGLGEAGLGEAGLGEPCCWGSRTGPPAGAQGPRGGRGRGQTSAAEQTAEGALGALPSPGHVEPGHGFAVSGADARPPDLCHPAVCPLRPYATCRPPFRLSC